ncbi:equilibrative nucleobase transporter 1-like [Cetorhinus maximus]
MDCVLQDERFALIFTVSSFMVNFPTFSIGFLFDYFGTMVTRLVGMFLYTTATLMIAFSIAESAVLLFPALSLLAVGGKIFFITNIQVGNLFENKRSTIITLYNGAFSSSAAVFLLVKVLYEAGLSLMSMFLFITCLSSILLLRTFFLLPRTRIPRPIPEGYSYGVSCAKFRLMSFCCEEQKVRERQPHHRGDRTQGEEGERREWTAGDGGERQEETEQDGAERWEEMKVTDWVNPQPSGSQDSEGNEEEIPSFRSCIFSKLFLFTLLWLSIIQLRDSLFIGTLNPTLTLLAKGDSGQVSRLTNAFACTQFCGIFCAPWNGLIMDRHKCRKKPSDTASGSPGVITQHPRSRRLNASTIAAGTCQNRQAQDRGNRKNACETAPREDAEPVRRFTPRTIPRPLMERAQRPLDEMTQRGSRLPSHATGSHGVSGWSQAPQAGRVRPRLPRPAAAGPREVHPNGLSRTKA